MNWQIPHDGIDQKQSEKAPNKPVFIQKHHPIGFPKKTIGNQNKDAIGNKWKKNKQKRIVSESFIKFEVQKMMNHPL